MDKSSKMCVKKERLSKGFLWDLYLKGCILDLTKMKNGRDGDVQETYLPDHLMLSTQNIVTIIRELSLFPPSSAPGQYLRCCTGQGGSLYCELCPEGYR